MKLSEKKKLAARILKVGVNRVWIDPARTGDISAAITREDIRRLVKSGVIRAKPARGTSRGRARRLALKRKKGRRGGPGSRKGAKHARFREKSKWIQTVRPLRSRLRELKREGVLEPTEYRRLYRMVRGGVFKSKAHLETHLKEKGILKG